MSTHAPQKCNLSLSFSRSVSVLWAHWTCQLGGHFSRQHSWPVADEFWCIIQQTSLSLRGLGWMCALVVWYPRRFIQWLLSGDRVCPTLPCGHVGSTGLEPRSAAPLSHPHATDEHWATTFRLAHCPCYTQPQVTHLNPLFVCCIWNKVFAAGIRRFMCEVRLKYQERTKKQELTETDGHGVGFCLVYNFIVNSWHIFYLAIVLDGCGCGLMVV